jgi:hypothetical protein
VDHPGPSRNWFRQEAHQEDDDQNDDYPAP